MKVTRFDSSRNLIVVNGFVWGPRARKEIRLAVDTGAGETVVIPEILDDVGYSPSDGEAITKIRSAVAEEPGYFLRVRRFRAWDTTSATSG